jgi:ethanolamine ammonia-lyase large subunit
LNALAIMEPGQLAPYLQAVHAELTRFGHHVAPEHMVVTSGRVRAGYRIGESLFGGLANSRAILHVIGERPGTGHRTFSIYITAPTGAVWGQSGKVDHNITRVVSGVALTALDPTLAAQATVRLLKTLV